MDTDPRIQQQCSAASQWLVTLPAYGEGIGTLRVYVACGVTQRACLGNELVLEQVRTSFEDTADTGHRSSHFV